MAWGHDEDHAKKMAYYFFFFRRIWVKGPRPSENVSDENCYFYRGIRQLSGGAISSSPFSYTHAHAFKGMINPYVPYPNPTSRILKPFSTALPTWGKNTYS